jgi:hypothetical protein
VDSLARIIEHGAQYLCEEIAMLGFQIIPLATEDACHVRETRTDPIFGYPYDVQADIAGPHGYGPCRQCLRKFSEGERRLLFLHNPFTKEIGDFAGPIFIHEDECSPFEASDRFPESLRGLPLMLRSYDANGHYLAEHDLHNARIEAGIQQLFQAPEADEIHIRNVQAKCFVAKAIRCSDVTA